MDRTLRFRQLLSNRIVHAAGLMAVTAPLAAACGGTVVSQEGEGGAGGQGGDSTSVTSNQSSSSSYSSSVTTSGTYATSSSSYATSSSSDSSTSTYGTTSASSYATTTASGQTCGDVQTYCIDWAYDQSCPAKEEALQYMPWDCSTGCAIWEVLEGPYPDSADCCYSVQTDWCGVGRPFVVEGSTVTASLLGRCTGGGWSAAASAVTETIDPALRAAVAEAWTRDALLEHASVASFARFALELMAVGAPSDLIEAAHRAALDEVRHARLCFALASAYGGTTLEPGAFPFGGKVDVSSDLAAIAVSTVLEGCVGETLASIQAAEQLALATDPAAREALTIIAEDEARHAELAWRTVAWAIQAGGAPVREAVAAAFARAARALPAPDPRSAPAGAEAHGRLDAPTLCAAMNRAMNDVILPAAAALVARPVQWALSADPARADATA